MYCVTKTTEGSSYFSVTWPNHKDLVVERLTHSLGKRQQRVNSQLPVLN